MDNQRILHQWITVDQSAVIKRLESIDIDYGHTNRRVWFQSGTDGRDVAEESRVPVQVPLKTRSVDTFHLRSPLEWCGI
ncbi:hypothetical protein TNCV_4300731 [Trichonephila clavipes]|nr:hypothetical protein TNCV_4300731 [Trichonephila clavipes]